MADSAFFTFFLSPIPMLLLLGLVAVVSYFVGRTSKMRQLQSKVRHLENERNELFVQCNSLREIIDNQELDIQRYASELKICTEQQQTLKADNEALALAKRHNGVAISSNPSDEGKDLMIKLLRNDLEQTRKRFESAQAQLEATEQVLTFMRTKKD
jgi:chromosome segregation ATPase